MALGAQRSDVLKMIVGQGMLMTIIGVVTGLGAALALSRLLSSLLYGVSPTDGLAFGAVSILLTVVALIACVISTRRATKVDPIVALCRVRVETFIRVIRVIRDRFPADKKQFTKYTNHHEMSGPAPAPDSCSCA